MRPLHAGSQADRILGYLAGGRALTTLQAVNKFGCLRLSERIRELKRRHHNIQSEMVIVGKKRVAQYWLSA